MRRLAAFAVLLAAAVLHGCTSSDQCTPATEKRAVADIARSWYLHPELLAAVNPADYADSEALLDALVAPAVAAGTDRGWSFITTTAEQQQYYVQGQSVGFGIRILTRNSTQRFIAEVYEGSAAWNAGFTRGDEILAIGDTEVTLAAVSGMSDAAFSDALGPSQAGVTRTFRVAPVADPMNPVVRTMTKSVYSLSPVSVATIPSAVLGRDVGVIVLRTFVSTADALLTAAFAQFQANDVRDVIVDVRYNGGGLISTAELLANLMGAGHSGQAMYYVRNNAAHASLDQRIPFDPASQSIQPAHVAFITTTASASASELVPNVLEPYLAAPNASAAAIALVGTHTYGKPVGQRGFDLTPCPKVLYLISFALTNAENEGGYFTGLPDAAFGGPLCDATDDLTHPQGTAGEASTAAALSWLESGTCPAPQAQALAGRALSLARPDAYPRPARPTLAQVENPGLF